MIADVFSTRKINASRERASERLSEVEEATDEIRELGITANSFNGVTSSSSHKMSEPTD